MKTLIVLLLSMFLSACAQLPERKSSELASDPAAARWLLPFINKAESTRLLLCDVEIPRQACLSARQGLSATGLGGIFLPLNVSLPEVTVERSHASLQVSINGKDASCTMGDVKTSARDSFIEISNVFCNWLVIGNVISSLKLSIDWGKPEERTFGGRYTIRFIGTGNGSGAGVYSAKVQS